MEQLDFQPTIDTPETELVAAGPALDQSAPAETANQDVKPDTMELPDPFGALKVWLTPNNLGAEVFRHENHHGR